jgi:hypothetical protein
MKTITSTSAVPAVTRSFPSRTTKVPALFAFSDWASDTQAKHVVLPIRRKDSSGAPSGILPVLDRGDA